MKVSTSLLLCVSTLFLSACNELAVFQQHAGSYELVAGSCEQEKLELAVDQQVQKANLVFSSQSRNVPAITLSFLATDINTVKSECTDSGIGIVVCNNTETKLADDILTQRAQVVTKMSVGDGKDVEVVGPWVDLLKVVFATNMLIVEDASGASCSYRR